MDWYFVLIIALAAVLVAHLLTILILHFALKQNEYKVDDAILKASVVPSLVVALTVTALFVFEGVDAGLSLETKDYLIHGLAIVSIAGVMWWLLASSGAATKTLRKKYSWKGLDDEDERMQNQKADTRLVIVHRLFNGAIIVVGIGAALMTFPDVRNVGQGLLASAGIVALVAGVAARPVLENLIASVQIGLAQPLKLGDVVIIDGEWGIVEDITGTYVVSKTWDERRLIIPLTKVISTTFENWSRTERQLLVPVYLWVDFSVPLKHIEKEFKDFVKTQKEWDEREGSFVVYECNDRAMQVRFLASASNSTNAAVLKYAIRRHMIEFVQENYHEGLPRLRTESSTSKPSKPLTE